MFPMKKDHTQRRFSKRGVVDQGSGIRGIYKHHTMINRKIKEEINNE
jgi:hypothetical protein